MLSSSSSSFTSLSAVLPLLSYWQFLLQTAIPLHGPCKLLLPRPSLPAISLSSSRHAFISLPPLTQAVALLISVLSLPRTTGCPFPVSTSPPSQLLSLSLFQPTALGSRCCPSAQLLTLDCLSFYSAASSPSPIIVVVVSALPCLKSLSRPSASSVAASSFLPLPVMHVILTSCSASLSVRHSVQQQLLRHPAAVLQLPSSPSSSSILCQQPFPSSLPAIIVASVFHVCPADVAQLLSCMLGLGSFHHSLGFSVDQRQLPCSICFVNSASCKLLLMHGCSSSPVRSAHAHWLLLLFCLICKA